mgnify:FL=1
MHVALAALSWVLAHVVQRAVHEVCSARHLWTAERECDVRQSCHLSALAARRCAWAGQCTGLATTSRC